MRYVSPFSELKLVRNNGKVAHQFFNGVLVIGDKTTRDGVSATGGETDSKTYTIDSAANATYPEREVQLVKTDLAGKSLGDGGFNRVQAIGLGSLIGLNYDLTTPLAAPALMRGYQGTFFEAPEISGTTNGIAECWYEVLSGTVLYNGVTYMVGDSFKVVTGILSIDGMTGTGTYALSVHPLVKKCACFTAEEFKIQHLEVGDESSSYWRGEEGGFQPRNSLQSIAEDFMGWRR